MTDINDKEDDFGSLGDFVTDDEDSAESKFGASDDDDDFNPADFGGIEDDDDAPEIEGIAGPGEAGFGGDGFDSDGFDDNDGFDDPFKAVEEDDGFGENDDEDDDDDLFPEDDASDVNVVDVAFGENDEFSGLDEGDRSDDGFDPEDDSYAAGASDEVSDVSSESGVPKKSLLSKLIVPVGGAIAAGVVGLIAYTQVMPMFSGGSQSPAVAPPAVATNPQDFPTQLPSLGAVQPAPVASPSLAQPLAPSAALPDLGTPATTPAVPVTAPVAVAAPVAAPLLSPQASTTTANVPDIPVLSPVVTQTPASTPAPEVSAALASVDVDRLNQVLEIDFDATSSEINRLQVQVAGLESAISGLESKIDDLSGKISSAPAAVGLSVSSASPPVIDAIQPKLKPEVIQGVRLTGYSPKSEKAWIKVDPELMGPDGPPSGRMVVEKGDEVPGAGKFVTVRRYNGRSIMVTSNGFVME